jgi:hypothetical protein
LPYAIPDPKHERDIGSGTFAANHEGIWPKSRFPCRPDMMLWHPDPHFEGVFHTETGGETLLVQYPGPSLGERLIHAGRAIPTRK